MKTKAHEYQLVKEFVKINNNNKQTNQQIYLWQTNLFVNKLAMISCEKVISQPKRKQKPPPHTHNRIDRKTKKHEVLIDLAMVFGNQSSKLPRK